MTNTASDAQGKVDWAKPIEAVHEDGRAASAMIADNSHSEDFVWKHVAWKDEDTNRLHWFGDNGVSNVGSSWSIRNVTPPNTDTDKVPDALVERMQQLIRDLHEDHVKHGAHDYVQDFVARTAAIVAELPKPIDSDLLLARQIVADDGGYDVSMIADGQDDNRISVRIALAAIKRVRSEGAA